MTPLRDQVTTPAPERPRQAPDPETLLLSGLFQRLPIVILLNLAVALGTVLVFAGRRPLAVIASWFLFMLATLALRLWAWQARRRATAAAALLPVRARQFTLGAAATGLAWGLAGVLFYSPDAQVSQIFLPFIMAGMVGGSVTALTGYMPAYVAFSTSMLVPYAARLAVEGDGVHLVMASLTLHYLVGMGLLARTDNASMVAAVRLAAENEALVAALREKSAQLEATFENVNQGVAVFDREGLLETWNPRHRALHGYRRSSIAAASRSASSSATTARTARRRERRRRVSGRPRRCASSSRGRPAGCSRSSAVRCRAAASSAPRPTSPSASAPKTACCISPNTTR
jgi:PAS domain-containing protein